jgi:UDP-N-acetylglucosamine 2-epimerase (non-hydrolysing)
MKQNKAFEKPELKEKSHMPKLKILSIFGTRPEATKMAPLILELRKPEYADIIQHEICVTAQHREQLDQMLKQFDIRPKYDLNLMKQNQPLEKLFGVILEGVNGVVREENPDLVLVHGDTATTAASALAAFFAKIPVGHIEAGLRSDDIYQPFPEEVNRRLTSSLATYHFPPTTLAKENLLKENISEEKIYVTGNTSVDVVMSSIAKMGENKNEAKKTGEGSKTILLTAHRTENLGKPLEDICHAVLDIAKENPDVKFIYPVHLNPKVRNTVFPLLSDNPQITLLDPVDVQVLHKLLRDCYLVMTDSGGIQEEAPVFKKPCVVLREVTERPEGVTAGILTIAGTDRLNIYKIVSKLLTDSETYGKMTKPKNPYGDGEAARRIAQGILYFFGLSEIKDEFNT